MRDPDDADLKSLDTHALVKFAAAMGGIGGGWSTLSGLQFLTSIHHADVQWVVLTSAITVFGAAQLPLAVQTGRNRHRGAIGLTVVTAIGALLATAWFLGGLANRFVSCFSAMAVPLQVLAACLAPLAIGLTKKADQARARLAASGIDLGN